MTSFTIWKFLNEKGTMDWFDKKAFSKIELTERKINTLNAETAARKKSFGDRASYYVNFIGKSRAH